MVDTGEIMEKVHEIVNESGLTVAEIAYKSGESEQKIRRTLEGKNPSFAPLCAIIIACGGSIDDVLGIERETNSSGGELVKQLRADLHHERKRGKTGWTLFVVMVGIMVGLLIFDVLNPQFGWVRYEVARQAGYGVSQTSILALGRIIAGIRQFIL